MATANSHTSDTGVAIRAEIVQYKCPAYRLIYVPVDDISYPFTLVIHGPEAHNHPIPIKAKVSIESRIRYGDCVAATGVAGMTVQKVDNGLLSNLFPFHRHLNLKPALSTRLLLEGKRVDEYDVALLNGRVKRDILAATKAEFFPSGNGLAGVVYLTALAKIIT